MKIVSPFRPFAPESQAHLRLGPFDWIGALRMLAASARESCHCETFAITDVDSPLPVPHHAYVTHERRLMLWILEVSLRYLESDDFDQDTVMVSPDILVFGDLRPYFGADLGVIVRMDEKYVHADRPLLNSVQWWAHAAKPRLVAFYRRALDLAHTLTEDVITWGADTVPLVALLSPLERGQSRRAGLTVLAVDQTEVMTAFSATLLRKTLAGRVVRPDVPLLDFKYGRKVYLQQYFDATYGVTA